MDDKHYGDEYDVSMNECPVCKSKNTSGDDEYRVDKYFDICIVEYKYICYDCKSDWILEEVYDINDAFSKTKINKGE